MTAYDCNTLVRSFGIVRLLAGSDNAGPYIIRVGAVIVGAFGFNRDGDHSDFVDVCSSYQQRIVYSQAAAAFESIVLKSESDDPSAIRQIARDACRVERNLPIIASGHRRTLNSGEVEKCPNRIELEVIRRPGNALNVEIGSGCDRCKLKPPKNWGNRAPSVARWLLSGGSPLILGKCTPSNCPSTNTGS